MENDFFPTSEYSTKSYKAGQEKSSIVSTRSYRIVHETRCLILRLWHIWTDGD